MCRDYCDSECLPDKRADSASDLIFDFAYECFDDIKQLCPEIDDHLQRSVDDGKACKWHEHDVDGTEKDCQADDEGVQWNGDTFGLERGNINRVEAWSHGSPLRDIQGTT